MRKMAPFVGDGSTRLEPSRRKARPALNARRVLEFDIRMWTFVGGKNTRGDASVGTSAQFDWLKLSQNKYQPDVQSIFLSISLSLSHLFLSLYLSLHYGPHFSSDNPLVRMGRAQVFPYTARSLRLIKNQFVHTEIIDQLTRKLAMTNFP